MNDNVIQFKQQEKPPIVRQVYDANAALEKAIDETMYAQATQYRAGEPVILFEDEVIIRLWTLGFKIVALTSNE